MRLILVKTARIGDIPWLYIELWKNNTMYNGSGRIFTSYRSMEESKFRSRFGIRTISPISEKDFQLIGNRPSNSNDNWEWVRKNLPEVFL